ncbi:tripartite tricarboxylate transporter substrate binding protein [Comamonas thiooxydans]|uniref:tripartite tricarboxylate transporter substrate binding protein n=1 Tax=Comamonas thiooxydans TaxID=363952 RepID=UPI000A5E2932|nr:tripartite tricarboxylate transporter substrate binding protein [Comamonas thiooxydans]
MSAACADKAASRQPVKIVVGFEAGGAMDTLARSFATQLSVRLQRSVYVENRVGAGGAIAANYVAKSRPDGNTLLLASPAEIFINPIYTRSQESGEVADMVPVAKISSAPIVLATRGDSAIHQLSDIAAAAQKNARGLSFASSGIGSLQHLVGESLGKALSVELLHVPYGGAASATASLMGKQVDLLFAGLAPIAPHLQSHKMHAVGIASAHRSKRFPDIPTFQEKGLQGVSFEYWQGIFLPKGASSELALFLSAEINNVIKETGFVDQLENTGFEVAYKDYKQFKAFLQAEDQIYRSLFKRDSFLY